VRPETFLTLVGMLYSIDILTLSISSAGPGAIAIEADYARTHNPSN
jgi:hypothetical protein